ncbi:MAG: conjugal transfer protein TraX [Clostridia bacterium]|nr:conjugal transfer protein TraX [Clostridia bacterium]
MNKIKCINSNALKILAMFLMLLDHLWATLIPGNQWMNMVGRMAFPIFAFLIVEGFVHTSDFKKYAKRLFVFGLISEIPFNLITAGSVVFPFHQNIMFTLLLGLLCVNEIEKVKSDKNWKNTIKSIIKIVIFLLVGAISFVDYGVIGILTIIAFYIFRKFKFAWLGQLVSLILLFAVFSEGQSIVIKLFDNEHFIPMQSFGIFALIPIWLYNGGRGKNNKLIQYGFYAFYPIHMAAIYLIYYFVF